MFGKHVPELQRIAVRVLSQACTASAAEQFWAQYEAVHTSKRNRLKSSTASQVLYVGSNLRFLRRYQSPNFRKCVPTIESSDDDQNEKASEIDENADDEQTEYEQETNSTIIDSD